ncbi:TM0106 family RecB-like putative nuclease [Nocardioides humilatus]|uniref:TM0106 family RecB-like putative nuclease n=1 Tax=Nocardioides humilatus TaxID=2607660 RepID=A0A5B1LHV3_9ACTN|nr:TM0106 family RecB-like putative nuclease [Nocardioides humilatus]KAA1419197.1 TM0106 family RecB-like putative nuclease [Nocardioides humilatus]
MARALLLTGYDAKRCARRIHNEWDPAVEVVPWEVPAELQMRFDAGIAFEESVFAELVAELGPDRCIDLSDVRGKANAVARTLAAMDEGIEVILGGWLPDDIVGGRTGKPDVLLRVASGRYVPGDVKGHKVMTRRAKGTLTYSTFSAPGTQLQVDGLAAVTTGRFDDHLQLAHYWRMLEAIGRAPDGPAVGFIIGRDNVPNLALSGRVLTWLDLEVPLFETYSRTQGKAKRSALERYDHEQGFRLKVATTAAQGEAALVEPVFTDECDSCPWYDHCRGLVGDDLASAHITAGRLSVREWTALASAGVKDVADLADLDVDDQAFRASYLPEVTHLKDPLGRLRDAVRRARMIRDGIILERTTTGPIVVPRADVEIDFDIEWDPDDRVYLWGALVHRAGAEPVYHPVVSWSELDADGCVAHAEAFAVWLRDQIAAADTAGESLLVYHYSHPEPSYLKRLLGEDAVADLLDRFVDLLALVREHYFGVRGLGIKQVAPAFGFEWRDDEAGGLQSQLWLIEARAAEDEVVRDAGRARILRYNEDDVRATAALRIGMSGKTQDDGE